jgi:hypothetical protein
MKKLIKPTKGPIFSLDRISFLIIFGALFIAFCGECIFFLSAFWSESKIVLAFLSTTFSIIGYIMFSAFMTELTMLNPKKSNYNPVDWCRSIFHKKP